MHAGQDRGAHKAPEIGDSTAQQYRKPRRLGRDVDKDGAGEKNKEHQQLEQVKPAGSVDCSGEKAGVAEVDHQLPEIG